MPKSTTLSVSPTGANTLGYYLKDNGNGTTSTVPLEDFTIYGWSGSSAADYANELGFKIIFADGLPTGDINGDKAADVSDATIVLNLYANQAAGLDISKYTQQQITAADVDGNGTVGTSDASYILTYYAQYGAGLNPIWEQILGK
ncbi:MAG: dockerin type I domain-containing protein [Ruminococcus sp.]